MTASMQALSMPTPPMLEVLGSEIWLDPILCSVICVASTGISVSIRSCNKRGKLRLPVLAITLPTCGNSRCRFILSPISCQSLGVIDAAQCAYVFLLECFGR
uniref:Uncharacterized protein n=1 Tax=Pseudomonas corrugata TaxID=47879 RepID=Q9F980_9PSED|nr:unknown [Pseudomonas corrugata]